MAERGPLPTHLLGSEPVLPVPEPGDAGADTGAGSRAGTVEDAGRPEPGVPGHAGRVAALDGVRALAVAAVLLYHAGVGWAPGGFLGVDVFFVLSGYLITGLLAGEYVRTGRISLRRFYLRRARRLLPALFTMIAGVCVMVVVWLPHEAALLRQDVSASLAYVTNWWFIAQGQSYFGGTGRPSLLLHLWSLAVEEQFYLLWPLLLILMLRGREPAMRARALSRALAWAVLLGVGSAGLMAYLYSPWSDPSRVYYGTDTRAFELLVGVVLALVQSVRGVERQTNRDAGTGASPSRPAGRVRTRFVAGARDASALAALGVVVFAIVRVPPTSPGLYPLGLVAVCGAAAVLIRAVVSGGAVAALFARRPMVWLGERSYALYLWHWPVFDVTRPKTDVTWPGPVVFLVRVGVSLVLAAATFRWIECPIRSGALGRIAGRCRVSFRERRFALPTAAVLSSLACAAAAAGMAMAVVVTASRYPADAKAIAVDTGPGASLVGPGSASESASAAAAASAPRRSTPSGASTSKPGGQGSIPAVMPAPPARPPRVDFVGDSQGMTLILNQPPDTARFLRLADDTTEGCGFLGGRVASRTGERRDLGSGCAGAPDRWASRVAADHPDAVVLMIGAWDVFDEQVNGATLAFGTAAWDRYYVSRLSQAVAKLKGTGVPHVELALLPCYRPVNAPGSGYWPERGDDSRTRHVNTLLAAFAGAAPSGVGTLAPPPQFCTDQKIATSLSYRWDGVHYYKPGARLYFEAAIPQLLAPLP